MKKLLCITPVISGAVLCGWTAISTAQSVPPPGVTIPPNAPERIEQTIPTPSETPAPLPTPPAATPPPSLETPAPSTPPESSVPREKRFFIKNVEVSGSTVLQREIADLIKQYEGKAATFEDLFNLRARITQLYTDAGYISTRMQVTSHPVHFCSTIKT